MTSQIRLYDLEPATDRVLREVLMGLQKPVKELPCKLLYDERGSHLFNQICQSDEYYLTRTETAIMRRYVEEMVSGIGPGCLLIEYGSGNSAKSRLLLNTLPNVAGYVPIDISKEHLVRVA
ncbi:MAG: L-histidine N(alpha)-methyltransferase, partial [Fidelibacterota bacterium]